MKKYVFLLLAIALFTGCSKKSTDSNPYSNSLQLGTGINATSLFDLTGVGTTFYANTTIYFRLESADDQGGSSITIQIYNSDGSSYKSFTYTNDQSYGHIFLSYFLIPDPRKYTAKGIIVNGNKAVASTSFTIIASK